MWAGFGWELGHVSAKELGWGARNARRTFVVTDEAVIRG